MKPIVAHGKYTGNELLIIEFLRTDEGIEAVCVKEGGDIIVADLRDIIVWRPTPDFPAGYRFHAMSKVGEPA